MLLYGLAGLVLIAVGVAFFLFRRARRDADDQTIPASPDSGFIRENTQAAAGSISFQTDATLAIQESLFKLAFGANRIDYQILGDHQKVLKATQESVSTAMKEPRYFPRKPALLPKLLRAINALDSGRNEIVRLILQDAVLAGNVLKRANSVYYRQSQDVVESIDRAVTILGNEGLRAVASAVMQPVFQLPSGFFEHFAPVTWEQARRTAIAAEELARDNRSADAFVAHLAGMLGSLARIVLFRLANDKYRHKGNIMPRAEVFIRVMTDFGPQVARDIAAAWEMSEAFLEALDAQVRKIPPDQMSPLAKTVYHANLCGTLATLHCHGEGTEESARDLLVAQGLAPQSFAKMWQASIQGEIA
jgi:HD-like signal output (HDOD) protein